jgi:hypothetical protein
MSGFEETFAPEIASLGSPAMFGADVEQPEAGPWVDSPTPPQAITPVSKTLDGAAKEPQPASRTEKHRLSLTFLKRASLVDNKGKSGQASQDGSGYRSKGHSSDHDAGRPTGAGAEANSEADRPNTRASNDSAGDHNSIRSRVGSVKKRLSLLSSGVGRRPSKATMATENKVVAESIREE